MIQNFKLVSKKNLTHNIYELDFECEKNFSFIPGQFVTFLLEVWWRAYSILEEDWKLLKLIIKKRELDEWGRWWSKFLCELNVWEEIRWVGPAGHFTLKDNNNNKLFLWTGTWFVPLYNQIISWLQSKKDVNFKLIFWARTEDDLFYVDTLSKLKENYKNFDYEIFLSNGEKDSYKHWYVTWFINDKTITEFSEAYICWIPVMIDSAKSILIENWFNEKDIYTEKY